MRWLALALALGGCDAMLRLQEIQAPDAAVYPNGLVAYYPFDDDQCATDVAGGHTGTCAAVLGRVAGPGKHGLAAFLDETSVITIPHAPELDPATAFTVAAWVAPDHYNADGVTYGCMLNQPYGTADGDTWQLCAIADDTLFIFGSYVTYKDPLGIGTWRHVAMTWDGSNVTSWIDGVAVDQGTTTQPAAGMRDLLIGADDDGAGPADFYTGAIDEIQIYNRALGADEMAALAK